MTAQHEPNEAVRTMVEGMAGAGIPQAAIAAATGLSEPTLRKHYRHELDHGGILATAKVAQSLFKKAIGDGPQSAACAMFWLKTRAGWREAAPKAEAVIPVDDARSSLEAKLHLMAERMAAAADADNPRPN